MDTFIGIITTETQCTCILFEDAVLVYSASNSIDNCWYLCSKKSARACILLLSPSSCSSQKENDIFSWGHGFYTKHQRSWIRGRHQGELVYIEKWNTITNDNLNGECQGPSIRWKYSNRGSLYRRIKEDPAGELIFNNFARFFFCSAENIRTDTADHVTA